MQPVVIVGPGEIGRTFASGWLRLGYPVFPVIRGQSLADAAQAVESPALVLVSVGEWDLAATLENLPMPWRDRVALVQNELVPSIWEAHAISPSVSIVWFEKRAGQAPRVLLPSVNFGPKEQLLGEALGALSIASRPIYEQSELSYELAKKNLYILTLNLAGLRTQGNAGHLLSLHHSLFRTVAKEVIQLQSALMSQPLPEAQLIGDLESAILADPEHGCLGRTARERLARALRNAQVHGLTLPTLESLGVEFLSAQP